MSYLVRVHRPEGGHLRPDNRRARVFDPAVDRAGLARLTPHHLRHTAATMWIDASASMMTVARRLGHEDTTMVERVYGHLYPEADDRLVAAMDVVFDNAMRGDPNVVPINPPRRPERPGQAGAAEAEAQ